MKAAVYQLQQQGPGGFSFNEIKSLISLKHTTPRCHYHIAFASKYRLLVKYGQIKRDIR